MTAIAARRRADLYLLLAPDTPWVDDDQRYFPDAADREGFFEACRELLDELGAAYVIIRGSHEERLRWAARAVEEFLLGFVGP